MSRLLALVFTGGFIVIAAVVCLCVPPARRLLGDVILDEMK